MACFVSLLSCNDRGKSLRVEPKNPIDYAWKIYYDTIRWNIEELLIKRDYLPTIKENTIPNDKYFNNFPLNSKIRYYLTLDTSRFTFYFPPERGLFIGESDSIYCIDEKKWLHDDRKFSRVPLQPTGGKAEISRNNKKKWDEFLTDKTECLLIEFYQPTESESAYYVQFQVYTKFSPTFVRYYLILDKKDLSFLNYRRYENAQMGKEFAIKHFNTISIIDSLWRPKYSFDDLKENIESVELIN